MTTLRTVAATILFVTLIMISSCSTPEAEPFLTAEYITWEKTVAEPLTYPIPGHGATRRVIFINDIGTSVSVTSEEGKERYDYPVGTIIVKENYEDLEGTSLVNITIMVKAPEHKSAMAGWVWLVKNPKTGDENVFTESSFCLTCHVGANEEHPYGDLNPASEFRDYVYFPYRKTDE